MSSSQCAVKYWLSRSPRLNVAYLDSVYVSTRIIARSLTYAIVHDIDIINNRDPHIINDDNISGFEFIALYLSINNLSTVAKCAARGRACLCAFFNHTIRILYTRGRL